MHVEILDFDDGELYSGIIEEIKSESDDPQGIIVLLTNGREGHIINIINSEEDILNRIMQETNYSDNKLDFLAEPMKKISIPKAIQSFLNAEGGWLYIGVKDDAKTIEEKLVGLESEKMKLEEEIGKITWGKFEDLYSTRILKALDSTLSSDVKFGDLVFPKLIEVKNVKILEIVIAPSTSPVFYKFWSNNKKEIQFPISTEKNKTRQRKLDEFHYRNGPDKKECETGEELFKYIKKRFMHNA